MNGLPYADEGIGLKLVQFDTSLDNVILEEHYYGVETTKGVTSNDLHVVRAKDAVRVISQGEPAQFTNTYLDTPRHNGMRFLGMKRAGVYNTQVLKVGQGGEYSDTSAFSFELNAQDNIINGFNINQPDLSTLSTVLKFTDKDCINNVISNGGGDYKMNGIAASRIINQTVYGCTGGMARHNNISRKCRASSGIVSQGNEATLTFVLDWEYPDPEYNLYVFSGKYSSRNESGASDYGDINIVVASDSFGVDSVLSSISGNSGCSWSIQSTLLDGKYLSVTVRNDGDDSSRIGVELERTVDPRMNTV